MISALKALTHIQPSKDNVPTLVKCLEGKHFIQWYPKETTDKDGKPKWAKAPIQKLSQPDTYLEWTDKPESQGLGLTASHKHHFVVLDIDGVDYNTNPQLSALLLAYPTYLEASPSGYKHNKYHAIYRLPSKADKLHLNNKPAITLTDKDNPHKQEIQLFSSTGYTTLTGQSLEGIHKYANADVAEISVEVLTKLWPAFRRKDTEKQVQSGLQVAPISAATSLDLWTSKVSCDPGDPKTMLLQEKLGYNHYEYWLTGLMAIHAAHGSGPQTMIAAMQWSESDQENYDDEGFSTTWYSITSGQVERKEITRGTYELYYKHFMPEWPVANKNGNPVHQEYQNFKFWLGYLGIQLQIDPVTQTIFFDGPSSILYPRLYENEKEQRSGGSSGVPRLAAVFTDYAREFHFRPTHPHVIDHLETLALQIREKDKVNRFAREIDDIEWDGFDYLTQLTEDIVVRNTHFDNPTPEFHHLLIKRWLFTVVRSFWPMQLAPGHRGDAAEGMLIVSSKNTGVGKSVFPSYLFPKEWDHLEITTEPVFGSRHEDKDFYSKICTRLIVNFDEIDKMLNSKSEASLKSYVTNKRDTFRPPYGRQMMEYPRLHATYSSTNKESLILARDGVRRWWWLNIDMIDLGVLKDGWPVMQLWAQVKHLLIKASQDQPHAKAPWHLADSELKTLTAYITTHTSENSLCVALNDMYDMTEEGFNSAVRNAEKMGYTALEATVTQTQIAETLGERKGKPLKNTLIEELRKIAPPAFYYGNNAKIEYGTYFRSRQLRFFMPQVLTNF